MPNVMELFQRYRDDVYRLALSYARLVQEAEDVAQTVFLKLMEQESLTPGKEKAWLMQVTANQCRSLLRSSWWKTTAPLDESLACPFETEEQIDLFQAVMELPPKYRVTVYLHYFEGYSTGEIAQLLKLTRSAVTTRLQRSRQLLRDKLKEDVSW